LINAPHDKEFVFHDGTRVKNLLELVSKIEHLGDHEFHQFVNIHKNDFSNWIEHVLSDRSFAQELRSLHSKDDIIKAIKDKIADFTIGNSIIKIPRIEDHSPHQPESRGESRLEFKGLYTERNESHAKDFRENAKKDTVTIAPPITAFVNQEKSHDLDSHEASHASKVMSGAVNNADSHKSQVHEPHILDHVPPILVKDRHHAENSDEKRSRRGWFKMFSKRSLSGSDMRRIGREEEDKFRPETELGEEIQSDARENALWIVLYVVLVLLIITLLVYKLFL